MVRGAPGRRRSGRKCVGVARRGGVWRRGRLASLIYICLRLIDLFGQMFELFGDLVVVRDLRLVALVGGLLVGVKAAENGLEQAVQLFHGVCFLVKHATGLRRGFGRSRGRAPNRGETLVGFRASLRERLAPSLVDVTARSRG